MFALAKVGEREEDKMSGVGGINVIHTINFMSLSHKEWLYTLMFRLVAEADAHSVNVTFEATNRIKLLEHADAHQVAAGNLDFSFAQSIQ